MCGGTFMELMIYPRYYNETTSIRIPINEHCYRVNVFPANHKAWGPESEPLYFTVTKLPQELTILAGMATHITRHMHAYFTKYFSMTMCMYTVYMYMYMLLTTQVP